MRIEVEFEVAEKVGQVAEKVAEKTKDSRTSITETEAYFLQQRNRRTLAAATGMSPPHAVASQMVSTYNRLKLATFVLSASRQFECVV